MGRRGSLGDDARIIVGGEVDRIRVTTAAAAAAAVVCGDVARSLGEVTLLLLLLPLDRTSFV